MLSLYALLIGFVLDALVGDPYTMPHPIRTFGNAIAWLEKKLNQGTNRKLNGFIAVLILLVTTLIVFTVITWLAASNPYLWLAVSAVFVFYGLANHMLIAEALNVQKKLDTEGLEAGRKQLSYIVGRDTTKLSAQEIRTAILETLSENLSDGVIAPMFYYALGGLPALFAYKMINTLDSMIGYKNERYNEFGFFAAKLDDVANYIPARITALLIAVCAGSAESFRFIVRFGHKHSSPNAGYPEAALAGALNCRFGGPNIYHGKRVEKPYIGVNPREILTKDVRRACRLNAYASLLFLALIALVYWLI